MTTYELPAGWLSVTLGEIAEINPTHRLPPEWHDETEVGFVPMAAVDEHSGQVHDVEIKALATVKSGKTRFAAGDILFAKITPCVENGKVALVHELPSDIGFGSTEFYVVRRGPECDARYLFFYLRTEQVREWAVQSFTGSTGRQRVPRSFMENLQISLPPLSVQRRIVAVLKRADELRRKRAEADRLTDQILPALFVKMFGDPIANPLGWSQRTIGQLDAYVTSGATPRGGKENYRTSGIPFVRSQNVLMNKLSLADVAYIPQEIHEQMKRSQVQAGDVLLNITGASIGRVAWVPEEVQEANVNQHVCIIRFSGDEVLPPFVSFLLSTPLGQDQILRLQSGSTRQGLNHEQVRSLKLAVPPIDLQQQFVQAALAMETKRRQQAESRATLGALFQTLLARAFRGELEIALPIEEVFPGITERQRVLLALVDRAAGEPRRPVHITPLMKYAFLFQQEGGRPTRRDDQLALPMAAEARPAYLAGEGYDFVPHNVRPLRQRTLRRPGGPGSRQPHPARAPASSAGRPTGENRHLPGRRQDRCHP